MKTGQQTEQLPGRTGQELDILTVTGMTEGAFKDYLRRHGDAPDACYLCKRMEGDSTLSLKEEGPDRRMATNSVKLQKIGRKVGETVLVFNLCVECCLLLDTSTDWTPDENSKD